MRKELSNIEIQKMIKELSGAGIILVDDPDGLNNICFEKNGVYCKFVTDYFLRENGMSMTHAFVRKEKAGSTVCKWVPITDEMFYQLMKTIIIEKLWN